MTDPTGQSSGSYRVLRGESWYSFARGCRSADRNGYYPGFQNICYGFRLVALPGQ